MLPLLYALRHRGVRAEYRHAQAARGIRDFTDRLPGGRGAYLAAARDMALALYRAASGPRARFFVDKTPRYTLVVDELLETFPEARFVVLWRNPLALAASMMQTWADGRWNLYRYDVDLREGLSSLTTAVGRHPDRFHAVRFEDLVRDPDSSLNDVFAHLGLASAGGAGRDFNRVELDGSMGDPTGTQRYQEVSEEPLSKWHAAYCNPLRRAWAVRYLRWIGADRLGLMGYDMAALVAEARGAPGMVRRGASDAIRMLYGIGLATWRRKAASERVGARYHER